MESSLKATIELFVKRLMSRSALTDKEVSALLELRGSPKVYRSHSDLVRRGDLLEHSCLVVDGLVGRFGQNGEGERQISGLYIAGDMADLPSVVSPAAGWGIGSLSQTTILRIPHVQLRHLASQYPGIAEAFWRDCVADGSIFSEWVVNVGRRDSLSRLAHLFCEMAVRSERAGLGDRTFFRLPITQIDLADATGLTGVHVNRILKKLREASIANFRSGEVTIQDWDQLVSVGDFDPAFLLFGGPSPRITEPTGSSMKNVPQPAPAA
ncbi:Crp/Fnr family transcriptional regulator [Sphingomonas arantia]|uniref:Crp/Fnr family transcriptional regulator n=1 Tax=Sphingomonas arantia TaxID=1460676 RepID=A0ABW4TX51_9SPHN